MQWRWAAFKLFASLLFFFSAPAYCLNERVLWLPAKYQTLFLDLKQSALAAEQLEECVEVLKGTIDLEQSRKGAPIFRVLCRSVDGMTYNEMVDGNTKATLTTPVVVIKPLTPEELEAQRVEEERRRQADIERKKKSQWLACDTVLSERIALMLNVKKLYVDYIEPEVFLEGKTVFVLDFNAEDLNKTALAYRAVCHIDSGEDLDLIIRARKR